MFISLVRRAPMALLFSAALFLTACSDNPADHDDDHDEHAEAHGMRVMHDGAVLYQVLEGEVSCDAQPCGITVSAGGGAANLEVEFLTENGSEIHSEDLGNEFTLTFDVADQAVAQVALTDRFALSVTGVTAGATRMQINLNHNGHADLTSPPMSDDRAVQIVVNP